MFYFIRAIKNKTSSTAIDENNEKKGASEENIDDENENEKKLETRAKVVLETTGERIVVRVSEIVERRE